MKLLILYLFMLGMLLSGAANKIFSKMQNSTKSEDEKFYHPFFQTFMIFFGELLCLVLYFIHLGIGPKETETEKMERILSIQSEGGANRKTDANIFLYIIPMLIDVVSSTGGFIALNFVEASVTLMLNGLGFLSIVIFSIVLLKRKLYRQHWLAVPLILAGITIVGYASMTNSKGKDDKDTKWIGFIFIFFTQIFGSLYYISEEFLFRKYTIHPMKAVGGEGLWGTLFYAGVLLVLQFIEGSDGNLCPQGRFDNTKEAYDQLINNQTLVFYTIALILTHAVYNGFGITITKWANSAQRSTMNSGKTAVVWIFFLLFQGPGHENFMWLQLVGFGILVLGTLIFNEILIIPYGGFNTNTQQKINEQRSNSENETEEVRRSTRVMSIISSGSLDSIPISPHGHRFTHTVDILYSVKDKKQ